MRLQSSGEEPGTALPALHCHQPIPLPRESPPFSLAFTNSRSTERWESSPCHSRISATAHVVPGGTRLATNLDTVLMPAPPSTQPRVPAAPPWTYL